MIEFDSLCYLQNHKTGCTFVETFLRQFCKEPLRGYAKHAAWQRRDAGKFYFVNVREPLDAYLSLFNYGLDGRGEAFMRLSLQGRADLYSDGMAGFPRWLEAVLDPANGHLVYPPASLMLAPLLGLQSVRFLRLASPGLETASAGISSREQLSDHIRSAGMVDAVVRYERLRDDLAALITGPLAHAIRDQEAALDWLRRAPRINASNRRDGGEPPPLAIALRERLRAREWLIYETFYSEGSMP